MKKKQPKMQLKKLCAVCRRRASYFLLRSIFEIAWEKIVYYGVFTSIIFVGSVHNLSSDIMG